MGSAGTREHVSPRLAAPWLIVGLTGFAYLLNYADRQVIFSMFPVLKTQLGFTNTQLGLTSAIFLWAYGISSPLAGIAVDRVDKKTLICLSVLAWSAVTLLTGVANSPREILIYRGLIGMSEALFVPAAVAMIAGAHGAETRSSAISLLFSAQVIGLVVGGALGGFVAQAGKWRVAFWALGTMGALYSVPYYWFLKRLFGNNPTTESELRRKPIRWGQLLRTPTYVSLCVAFPSYTALLWLLYTWLPTFLFEDFNLSLTSAGVIASTYMQTASVAGLICGGIVADRLCRWTKAGRFWVLCSGMILSSPWAHVATHAHQLFVVKLALIIFGVFGGMFMANLMASVVDVVDEVSRGKAVGLVNCIGAPVSGLSAFAVGALKDKIGIANIVTSQAAVAMIAGLLLIVSVKMFFARDHESANQKTAGDINLSSLGMDTGSKLLR
jgi:MFS transporter, Spinster family, sphingosine-1-phosphate transporter